MIALAVLAGIGGALMLYFWLWMRTWAVRAWAGPNATEIPLWRWLLRKAVHYVRRSIDRAR